MATIYEKVIIPEKTVERISHVECDLCGKEGTYGWETSNYEVAESKISIEVRLKEGESYPDGGCGKEWKYDICPKCFKTKIVSWFESQGVYKERDWDF